MGGRAFQANGIDLKRVGGVSKFPLSRLLRLQGRMCRMWDLPQPLFHFIWAGSSSVALSGHFKISEMCIFLKCSWSSVLEVDIVQTAIDSTVSQKGRPGKH